MNVKALEKLDAEKLADLMDDADMTARDATNVKRLLAKASPAEARSLKRLLGTSPDLIQARAALVREKVEKEAAK